MRHEISKELSVDTTQSLRDLEEQAAVGNDDAGNNLAGRYSLVATCEANQVNPTAYLTDVLYPFIDHRSFELVNLK